MAEIFGAPELMGARAAAASLAMAKLQAETWLCGGRGMVEQEGSGLSNGYGRVYPVL